MSMNEKMFMRVKDVMEVLEVSEPYAYKLMRQMNKEMKNQGYHVIPGRIDRKFFYEHFYGTKEYERRNQNADL